MFSSRNLIAGLLALGFAADPAFAIPETLYSGDSPAESCAAGVAVPGAASTRLKRLCEDALTDPSLRAGDRAATLANSGIVSLRLGDYDAALARLDEARDAAPANADIAISYAATLLRLDRADEAVAALADIETISDGNRHIAYYNRALAHLALKDVEEAYRDFYVSAALKPGYAPAERALAQFQVAAE
ncbi:MAG: tetratricopeptide repeat protein [Hyphomonas sp.]|nr:tetratricopeptide repeat protein [Hyphomonas sp.]